MILCDAQETLLIGCEAKQ